MKWTENQNNAIHAQGGNIIVSAAAGSGKTAVLVQRVIEMITDPKNPADLDRLLIVTFTNAAAAEMKSRISAAIQRLIHEDPYNRRLLKQLSLVPGAKICTIDSFCLNLVKENFFKLGISQDFRLMDESRHDILKDVAIETVLEEYYEENSPAFINLVRLLSTPKNDKILVDSVKALHNYIYAQAFPFQWLDEITELYRPGQPFEQSLWYQMLKKEILSALDYGESQIQSLITELEPVDELYEKYLMNLNSDLAVFTDLKMALGEGWDIFIDRRKNVKFTTLASKRNYTSPLKAKLAGARSVYKKIITDDIAKYTVGTSEDYQKDLQYLFPVMQTLAQVLKRFDSELMRLKTEENSYYFSDIEHFAIRLLCDTDEKGTVTKTDFAVELEESFDEILIDEYQDTNKAQDILFQCLSNGKNRFMVGDVKQSIYRFRLAMPQIFTEKKNSYYPYRQGLFPARIVLDKNFRSRKGICDYVNFVFSRFMSVKTGDLDYNQEEFLNYGAAYEPTPVPSAQIKILNGVEQDAEQKEAEYIAKTILQKIRAGEKVLDNGIYRSVRYGDFAVLMRSVKKYAGIYSEIFTKYSIPVICDNAVNLFENNEVRLLLAFLKVIDNPMQDIYLLSVMMSPLYGFSADDMTQIRLNQRAGSLYSAVYNARDNKITAFRTELDELRQLSVTMSLSSFIRYIMERKNISAYACAMGNGEQRCLNLESFLSLAEQYERSESLGLTAFIRYIDRIIETGSRTDTKSAGKSGENAVKIMSVHHSKGLEFPIVILASAVRKYNIRELSEKILLNPEYGVGLKIHNEDGLYQYESVPYSAIRLLNSSAMMSENLRVLYVAMTRAKEQFISFITLKDIEKRIDALSSKIFNGRIDPYIVSKLTSDADILLISALQHKGGQILRSYCGQDIKYAQSEFDFSVEIVSEEEEVNSVQDCRPPDCDQSMLEAIRKKLSFSYSDRSLSGIRAKRAASDLDADGEGLRYIAASKPAFLSESGLTYAQIGTAMHTFMQYCNYQNAGRNLEQEIMVLLEKGYLSQEQADVLDRPKLNRFFFSDFAKRIFSSSHVYREIKVSSFVPVSDIEKIDSDEKILIQGIADCVFEEDGGLVLIDYKTDRVSHKEELLRRYEKQLRFYQSAVEKTLQKPVKEVLLYSFHLDECCQYKFI